MTTNTRLCGTEPRTDPTDAELAERLLKPADSTGPSASAKLLADWPALQEQLRRKGVTLQLLLRGYQQARRVAGESQVPQQVT